MRRSSSTISICALSSTRRLPARFFHPLAHAVAVFRADQMRENIAVMAIGIRPRLLQGPADAGDLRRHQALPECFPLFGEEKQPVAAVAGALPLIDISLADQILQHPSKTLLGNAEDIEQLGDGHAGVTPGE